MLNIVDLTMSQMHHNIVEHCERPKICNSHRRIRDADECRKEIQDLCSSNYVAIHLFFGGIAGV